jgi:hypothetical protein
MAPKCSVPANRTTEVTSVVVAISVVSTRYPTESARGPERAEASSTRIHWSGSATIEPTGLMKAAIEPVMIMTAKCATKTDAEAKSQRYARRVWVRATGIIRAAFIVWPRTVVRTSAVHPVISGIGTIVGRTAVRRSHTSR